MTSGSTTLDRVTSVPLAALGVLLLLRTHGGSSGEPLAILIAVLGAFAVASAARMWCRSCFESHLLGALVAIASTSGQLLAVAVGPPGGRSAVWTSDRLAVTGLGALVLLLLLVAAGRARRHGRLAPVQPYAR